MVYMVNKWKKIPIFISILITTFLLIKIPKVEANKYIMTYLYGMGNYNDIIEERGDFFNEVSPSYFDINENGSLKLNYIDENFVTKMKSKGIKVVPFLSNHWNRALGRNAVQNYEKLSSEISEAVIKNNLDGINIDIENLTEQDRDNYINLVKGLKDKLPKEKMLVVSVAANPTGINVGWQGSYDYEKLSSLSDYIMIMAYDEHYEGGEAGPVASIDFVEKSIQYALKHVSKENIVLGIPLYGRYWSTKTNAGGGGVSLKQIDEILEKYDSIITFDNTSKSPKALVNINSIQALPKIGGKTLEAGQYEFWYENEKSIDAKLDLIAKYDLKGVGMWKVGLETYSVWKVIREKIEETIVVLKDVFEDVSSEHWAYEHIKFVNEKSVMIGKEKNAFKPEDSLTRAELATIIARISKEMDIDFFEKSKPRYEFIDIKNHWAEEEIKMLQEFEIINGYENMEFRPDNVVTRAETCAIVNRMLAKVKKTGEYRLIVEYEDITPGFWAYSDIENLVKKGIVNGYQNGRFYPQNAIKRSEMAKIIRKLYEIIAV